MPQKPRPHINTTKYKPNGRYDPYELYELYQFGHGEPDICRHFGCGRQLSDKEKLYGLVCQLHSGEEITNKTLLTFLVQKRGR